MDRVLPRSEIRVNDFHTVAVQIVYDGAGDSVLVSGQASGVPGALSVRDPDTERIHVGQERVGL
jgi:hypothetical protein